METPKLFGQRRSPAQFSSAACVPALHGAATVTSITEDARIVTKFVILRDILRSFATAFVISAGAVVGAHPLEDAAATAVRACVKAGSRSIVECGNLSGKSSEASVGRKAAGQFYDELNRFYAACDEKAIRACHIEAEWLSYSGMTRAIEASERQSPRSDTRR